MPVSEFDLWTSRPSFRRYGSISLSVPHWQTCIPSCLNSNYHQRYAICRAYNSFIHSHQCSNNRTMTIERVGEYSRSGCGLSWDETANDGSWFGIFPPLAYRFPRLIHESCHGCSYVMLPALRACVRVRVYSNIVCTPAFAGQQKTKQRQARPF